MRPHFTTKAGTPCVLDVCAGMARMWAVAVYQIGQFEGQPVTEVGPTFTRLAEFDDYREARAAIRQIRGRLFFAGLNPDTQRSAA